MAVKIFDSLSGKKKPLPRVKELRLFVCGPTVYDYAHLGHARTYIFFDFFVKYLRSLGIKVSYLQNITDIDDKIIARAQKENKSPKEVAEFYTKAYLEDMKRIGVDSVTNYAPATKFIPQIIAQTERLIKKGYGYQILNDGYYFDISKFKDYGKLSRRSKEQAESATSRIDESVGKRNKGDFCLWKFSKPGEPTWKAKIGNGRPGWHIEDTAITEEFFGPQYDIHGGGVDLKFPHHEAEIAQQESASGKKPLVKIWMHTGFLLADGKKMSKSLGNFITIRDFLEKYSPDALRLITLTHHYRSPIDFSEDLVKQSEATINTLKRFLAKLNILSRDALHESQHLAKKTAHEADKKFNAKLEDDINSAAAIAELFQQIFNFQFSIFDIPPKEALTHFNYFNTKLQSLGFFFETPKIPSKIEKLANEREQFRINKQFIQSDALRKQIDSLGYEVEDTPAGPFIWPKNQHN